MKQPAMSMGAAFHRLCAEAELVEQRLPVIDIAYHAIISSLWYVVLYVKIL